MPLSKLFKETVKERADNDPEFRAALLVEAIELLLEDDMATGKAMLRDYINATIGFEELAEQTDTPSKSLMRMFSPKGNPSASKLFAVIQRLQKTTCVHLSVRTIA